MLFKGIHINKVISAALLVMLLLIHSIKLLHTHSGDNLSANSNSEIIKSSSDCGICNYQLAKDANDLVHSSICNYGTQPKNFDTKLISAHKFSFHTAFENRGPPCNV